MGKFHPPYLSIKTNHALIIALNTVVNGGPQQTFRTQEHGVFTLGGHAMTHTEFAFTMFDQTLPGAVFLHSLFRDVPEWELDDDTRLIRDRLDNLIQQNEDAQQYIDFLQDPADILDDLRILLDAINPLQSSSHQTHRPDLLQPRMYGRRMDLEHEYT